MLAIFKDSIVSLCKSMGKFKRQADIAVSILLIAGFAVLWVMFAPIQLGGQAAYAIVSGISMEPNFHAGDLAIMRRSPEYQVGDIVVYRNGEIANKLVIHRIIDVNEGLFSMKGDNNTWVDSYHPTQDEIVGKLRLRLPGLGKTIGWLRLPLNMFLTLGLIGGILLAISMIQPSKQGRTKGKKSTSSIGPLEGLLLGFGVLMIGFLVLGIFSFTRPLQKNAENIPYLQNGTFSYSAAGTPGIYDSNVLHSGEPIFPKLTCALDLNFIYTLVAGTSGNISGVYKLYAIVRDEQSGWQRTLPLVKETAFEGNSFSTSTALDLCQVEGLVSDLQAQTDLRQNIFYLTIGSQILTDGKLLGQVFHEAFEPQLVFKFDKLHFYVQQDNTKTNPLETTEKGFLGNPVQVANTISVGAVPLEVDTIRKVAEIGLLISLVSLLALGLYAYSLAKASRGSLIQMKYGSLIVDVYESGIETSFPIIEIASIDDLAKIAERENSMILHRTHLNKRLIHYYLVQSHETTFRYVTVDSGITKSSKPAKSGPTVEKTADVKKRLMLALNSLPFFR
jgi:signal peptidase I